MDNIHNFLSRDPRYSKLLKPLQAADICGKARKLADGQYDVISFKNGLLTLGATSPAAASNLRMKTYNIQKELNEKLRPKGVPLEKDLVTKIRIKIN